ncbi:hypothetical protein GHT06_018824 [Daphnia sinensis]|uniref:Cytosol aminopeptidase domain-containing protein n=1 Tax=Daphnia sinensis TaxID=1820382 RepID=A0AAD5L6J7_9CRUS|nr:hypothetical protein GHT06_018824 [Daphnia sinensis]
MLSSVQSLRMAATTTGARWVTCAIEACKAGAESDSRFDGVVLVSDSLNSASSHVEHLLNQSKVDAAFEEEGGIVATSHPSGRTVYAPLGALNKDFSDVRSYGEAAEKGIKRALSAGIKRPLLSLLPVAKNPMYKHGNLVSVLGALQALYVPLEVRECLPEKAHKAEMLGLDCPAAESVRKLALALENGRIAGRDIGGSDPERMAPPRVEQYIRELFDGSSVSVEVISDLKTIEKEYPLFAAVNRCANDVPRHAGRVIYLRYKGSGPIEKTIYLVGKGVTYDTGGCDIKAGGVMAGMHRDKCGSAAVAAFMKVVDELKPTNVEVVGAMAMVRNSVGSNAYVSDEIVTSRAGVRVRVGNTDAEGRMAMADVLCKLKEEAVNAINPQLMTIATLTGHAYLAVGEPYSIILDNGPAARQEVSKKVQEAGNLLGDMFEISTIRKEDYAFHKGKSEYEDVLQCNNLPSSRTPRGHQAPAAFIILASGLNKHGIDGAVPLPFSHLDIAAASGPFPGIPSSAPVLALARYYLPQFF